MQHTSFLAAAAVLTLLAAGGASAEGIHKCVTALVTSYQSAPCTDPRFEVAIAPAIAAGLPRVEDARVHDDASQRVDAPVDAATSLEPMTARLPFGRVPLAVGMYDVEALNSPRWGRPSAIARSRDRRGWREVWTYERGLAGPRELEFLNGRLIAIAAQPDAMRVATAGYFRNSQTSSDSTTETTKQVTSGK